jgi:hypothetical protein
MPAALRGDIDDVMPRRGEAVTLRFDGREVAVWWGRAGDDDRVAVREGRVLTWPTADAVVEDAHRAGWQGLGAEDGDPGIGRSTLDFEPAQAWLRGQRATLDPESALNLWNFAGDVAGSTGCPWRDRGRIAERCYRKLFAANVPWFFKLPDFQPRWLANELRCIREVLNNAVHLLRTESS